MKNMLTIIMLLIFLQGNSQRLAEWTNQKKTQIKYLLEQIAANQAYIGYIKKGYEITAKGLNTIKNIKNKDLNLHRDFISSLGRTNPNIKSYSRIADIIICQTHIVKDASSAISRLTKSRQFTIEEVNYISNVYERLLEECLKKLEDLFQIIRSGELHMKDDERIKRIDQLYWNIQDKYIFCKSFYTKCATLSMQRASEQRAVNLSKKLNGIK